MSTIEKALAKQKQAAQNTTQSLSKDAESTVKETNDIKAEIRNDSDTPSKTSAEKTSSFIDKKNVEKITLDTESLNERGFIINPQSSHQRQEEFRHIKRKLLNNAFGPTSKTLPQSNLIMVSSSSPNEGKTFISINLALSIALEQDKTVLLVDADVLRPSIHKELDFEMKQGLLEYLLDEVNSLGEVIYNTNIPNLKLIPAGKPHHLTNELLAGTKMATLAQELAERYPDRIVIFDCPPILGVTETPVLSSLVGQAVIVVEASKTKLEAVNEAVSQLNQDIAIGIVMNKTISSKKDEYGYYGYGFDKNK